MVDAQSILMNLLYRNGEHRGRRVPVVEGRFLIGRHESCDLQLQSDKVSRRHCVIIRDAQGALIQDQRSRNGTVVNGRRLAPGESCRLSHHDKVQVSAWKFRVSLRYQDSLHPVVIQKVDSTAAETQLPDETMAQTSTEALLRELDMITSEMETRSQQAKANMAALHGELDPLARRLQGGRRPPRKEGEKPKGNVAQDEPSGPGAEPNSRPDTTMASTDETAVSEEPAEGDEDLGTASDSEVTGPQKIPVHLRPQGPADSRDAASRALRRHFNQ